MSWGWRCWFFRRLGLTFLIVDVEPVGEVKQHVDILAWATTVVYQDQFDYDRPTLSVLQSSSFAQIFLMASVPLFQPRIIIPLKYLHRGSDVFETFRQMFRECV